jgi:hypothetical protein
MTEATQIDWLDEVEQDEEQPTSTEVVGKLLEQMIAIEKETLTAELRVKELAAQKRKIEEELLPAALDEMGVTKIVLEDGRTVSVDEVITATITKAKEAEAFGWLIDHGHAPLIKPEVKINLTDTTLLAQLEEEVRQLDADAKITSKQSVHWQTLRSFVKEQLERTEDFPEELFGVYRVRKAIVK